MQNDDFDHVRYFRNHPATENDFLRLDFRKQLLPTETEYKGVYYILRENEKFRDEIRYGKSTQ